VLISTRASRRSGERSKYASRRSGERSQHD